MRKTLLTLPLLALPLLVAGPEQADSACCYFAAKDKDVLQPAQKAFLTWDAAEKVETFTVQPKFEGNAADFGMVIPTPARPKLDEMPKDFFKSLAIYSILKNRVQPYSKLLPSHRFKGGGFGGAPQARAGMAKGDAKDGAGAPPPKVIVLEAGIVGSLDYTIISAERADDLYAWLAENKYSYSGDEATLDFYIKKKW